MRLRLRSGRGKASSYHQPTWTPLQHPGPGDHVCPRDHCAVLRPEREPMAARPASSSLARCRVAALLLELTGIRRQTGAWSLCTHHRWRAHPAPAPGWKCLEPTRDGMLPRHRSASRQAPGSHATSLLHTHGSSRTLSYTACAHCLITRGRWAQTTYVAALLFPSASLNWTRHGLPGSLHGSRIRPQNCEASRIWRGREGGARWGAGR